MQQNSLKATVKQRTAALMIALTVFGMSYPLTNAYTHHLQSYAPNMVASVVSRYDVLPFMAWTIVPYTFSFVLFVVSFYLVSFSALSLLLYRLLMSTLMACLCFYLFPLKFSFDKSLISETWQWTYEVLHAVDKPYNQLPSLHACYAVIFWVSLWNVAKERNISFWWQVFYRLMLSVVCVAIAGATLFTWQHHLADVLAGFVLALCVLMMGRWLMKLPRVTSQAVMKFWTMGALWFLWWAITPVLIFKKGHGLGGVWAAVGVYGLVSLWLMSCLYINRSWIAKVLPKQGDEMGCMASGKFHLLAYVFGLPIMATYQIMWQVAWRGGFARHDIKERVIGTQSFDVMAIGHLPDASIEILIEQLKAYHRVVWVDACAEMSSDFCRVYQKVHDKVYATDCPNQEEIKWHYINLSIMDLQYFDDDVMDDIHVVHELIKQEPIDTLVICQCAMGWSRSVATMMCLLALEQRCTPWQVLHDTSCHKYKIKWEEVLSSYPNHHAWRLLLSCTHYY